MGAFGAATGFNYALSRPGDLRKATLFVVDGIPGRFVRVEFGRRLEPRKYAIRMSLALAVVDVRLFAVARGPLPVFVFAGCARRLIFAPAIETRGPGVPLQNRL